MPARHRCLCQSRPVIWLSGLFIQLKRAGLSVRRFFAALKRAGVGLVIALLAALKWLVAFPPKAIHWLWTSLFWPTEDVEEPPAPPPRREITNLHKLTEGRFEGPTWWERMQQAAAVCWRFAWRGIRIGRVQLRRAIFRVRMEFQKHTAWTLATITGSLGILLMLVLQLMYSFQSLKAKEAPVSSPQYHTTAKTRIDPGFPQVRTLEPSEPEDLAQIDPFAPAQPDPSLMPQELPPEAPGTPTGPEPLDFLPPLQPVPAQPDRQPPREPEPFVDPLDTLPPYDPNQYLPQPQPPREPVSEPFSPVPSLPTEPQPPSRPASEPPPSEESPFEPPLQVQEPQIRVQPTPGETPPFQPPQAEPDQFIDPLDMLPLSPSGPSDHRPPEGSPPSSLPSEVPNWSLPEAGPKPQEERVLPANPNPSIDPLDNWKNRPPTNPEPSSDRVPDVQPLPPMENPPPAEPNPFVDPLDRLPPQSPQPDDQPGPPSEFDPQNPAIPPMQNPPPADPNPFEDPLDRLPPQSPQPDDQPGLPSEFDPQRPPVPPMENPPPAEPNSFVDPLDSLPPKSPRPEDQQPGPPLEFDPQSPPVPPTQDPPPVEPNPIGDPLDNFPAWSPQPETKPRPPVNPPEREPDSPMSKAVPGVELGVGFQRLPAERDERFLLESDVEYRRNTLSREIGLDAWERYLEQKRRGPVSPRPYWERISLDERRRLEQDLRSAPPQTNYEPLHPVPRGELNLAIAKLLPSRSSAHEPLKYEILVENHGREMIENVEVDEAVPPSHLLTDVSPAGYFENNLLRWRLRDLRPGEQRRLAVEVIPSETGQIETTTSVRPSARVSTVTEVESAVIRLRRSGYRTMALDESVRFTNHVQNLSETTQRDVSIVEQVPAGYRVNRVGDGGEYDRQAHTITWNLAALPAGKTVELNVHLQAESTGELISRVQGSTRDGNAVPILARVFVDRRIAGRVPASSAFPMARRVNATKCSLCGCRCCRCTACRR